MRKVIYEVLEKIEQEGYQAYLIGGYPRDLYLGRVTDDFDICTNAKPEDLKKIFSNIMEENYGSLKIMYKEIIFEVTTFRIEQEYISVRTPIISYANSLEEDLLRRDFIINTLCMDKNENYIDILNAKKDLDNKIIRAVGNAYTKMKEDPLRILRAIRFATVLDFKIEDTLKDAIIKNKALVLNLSYYRKKEELSKILLSKNCNYGISLLNEFGLASILECNLSKVVPIQDLEAMWSQFAFSSKYPFTKKERKKIEILKHLISNGKIEDIDLYYHGLEFTKIASMILGNNSLLEKQYSELPIHSKEDIAIDFNSIREITQQDISKVLSILEKEIIKRSLLNESDSIKAFLKEYFK